MDLGLVPLITKVSFVSGTLFLVTRLQWVTTDTEVFYRRVYCNQYAKSRLLMHAKLTALWAMSLHSLGDFLFYVPRTKLSMRNTINLVIIWLIYLRNPASLRNPNKTGRRPTFCSMTSRKPEDSCSITINDDFDFSILFCNRIVPLVPLKIYRVYYSVYCKWLSHEHDHLTFAFCFAILSPARRYITMWCNWQLAMDLATISIENIIVNKSHWFKRTEDTLGIK